MKELTYEDIRNAQKDIKKFNIVYLKIVHKLYSYAYYLSSDKHIAEDTTSETIFKIINSLGDFEGEPKAFVVWCLKILRNTTFNNFKKENRNIQGFDFTKLAGDTEDIDKKLLLKKVWESTKVLNSEQIEALTLKYKHDYSYKEIAEILEISEENARQIISRALTKLRKNNAGELLRK